MRFIKYVYHIKVLTRNKIIGRKLGEQLFATYMEYKDNNTSLEGIVLLEEGDSLKTLEFFGVEKRRGGIIGINPMQVEEKNGFITYVYVHKQKIICLVFSLDICDKEIKDYLGIFLSS